jgi:hypothetical protein
LWGNDTTPGLEPPGGGDLDGGAGGLAFLAADLLLVAEPHEFDLHAVEVLGLGCGDGGEEADGGVEGAVGVVAGEGFLVGPLVAVVAEFADEAAFGGPEGLAEDVCHS